MLGSPRDGLEFADAACGLADVVYVQRLARERDGQRERRRGQGQAAGQDGLEDPLGHLLGPGVPAKVTCGHLAVRVHLPATRQARAAARAWP